jgi:serine/threonine-protein kinase
MALIAYRDGHFEQTAKYSERSYPITGRRGAEGALGLVVHAMALHQLKQPDQARKTLAEATVLIPDVLATLGSPEFQGTLPVSEDALGPDWHFAEILRREAALLIHKNSRRLLDAAALRNLGLRLFNQDKFNDALTAFRQALDQEERHGWTHDMVGMILFRYGKVEEAIREFRRATEVAPDFVQSHMNLGMALFTRGKLEEASMALRTAIKWNAKIAPVHSLLGQVLLHQGKLDEAAASLSKAIELNPRDDMSIQLRAAVTRLQALLPKLDRFLDGTEKPADNAQRLDLAQLCFYRQRFAAAARFYAAALDADPKLAGDLGQGHRYNTACAAARAGNGDGDGAKLDAAERGRLRKQAIDWLRAELDAVTKLLAGGNSAQRPGLLALLRNWQVDHDLASLRDAGQLDKLPEDEQATLKRLWSEVDGALKRKP